MCRPYTSNRKPALNTQNPSSQHYPHHETSPTPSNSGQIPGDSAAPFLSASATSFLAWSVTGLFLTLVPSYALSLSGSSNLALAGGVVALLFAGSGAAQLRSRSVPPRTGQAVGLVGLMVGLVLLVGAGEARSLPMLLLATIVAGLGQGLAFVGAMTEVGAMAPADRQAEVMSSFYVITYIGTGAPVIGVGLLASGTDLLRAVEAFAAVLVVAVTCQVIAFFHREAEDRGTSCRPAAPGPERDPP